MLLKNYYSFTLLFLAMGTLFKSPGKVFDLAQHQTLLARKAKTETSLQIQNVDLQDLGSQFSLTTTLNGPDNFGVGFVGINYYIDGKYYSRSRTDFLGRAMILVKGDLTAGSHYVRAEFRGNQRYAGTIAFSTLFVRPATIEVQTVPAVPNVHFRLGEREFSSDENGVASTTVDKAGTYQLQMLPYVSSDPNMRVEFGRWLDEDYHPSREINVPVSDPLQVGLSIDYRVGQRFIDLDGKAVDPTRVTSFVLKSAKGEIYTFTDGSLRWLPGSRVARRVTGLEEVKIQYSVMDVTVDGSNVVNKAQQRFYGKPGDIWDISLLLYSAHFSAKDALFKVPVGSGIQLEYPDGHTDIVSFDSRGEASVPSLARGLYHVRVAGVAGIAPSTPVAMSKDQDAELLVVTRLDMAVAVALGFVLAIGLLLIGRPRIVLILHRRLRALPIFPGTRESAT